MSQTANEMVEVLQAIPGAASVKADQVGGAPLLDVELDRAMIARYGLTVKEVADTVATALGGRESGLLYEGDRRYDIAVRVPDATRARKSVVSGTRGSVRVDLGGRRILKQRELNDTRA